MEISNEAEFRFDELFYSKTDNRGIIQTGNSVFQRVSGYNWDELIDKPHSTIRHPDMPRGVFHLFWDYLKAGRPIGAFVKNKSKDGRYYWVFALAMPVASGYISVRLKPGGEVFQLIENEYRTLRELEINQKISPKESEERLLSRLKELGFTSYTSFMTAMLSTQIENRCAEMKAGVPSNIQTMKQLQVSSTEVMKNTKSILLSFEGSKLVPLNLEVQSARLGSQGQQLLVVANQYQKMATEINTEIENFEKMSKLVNERIEMGQFYLGASQLMADVLNFLSEEKVLDGAAKEGVEEVRKLSESYLAASSSGIAEIIQVVEKFISICKALSTLGSGLELVRITGRIESARLGDDAEVDILLNELKDFKIALDRGLSQISLHNSKMNQFSEDLLQELRKGS